MLGFGHGIGCSDPKAVVWSGGAGGSAGDACCRGDGFAREVERGEFFALLAGVFCFDGVRYFCSVPGCARFAKRDSARAEGVAGCHFEKDRKRSEGETEELKMPVRVEGEL